MIENEDASADPTFDELVGKLRVTFLGFQRNLASLHEKLQNFDSDPQILDSLENYKKDAESRATSLEDEVKQLRDQLSAVRDFLGLKS